MRLHGRFCHLLLWCQTIFSCLSKTILQRVCSISIFRVCIVGGWHVTIAGHGSILKDNIWQQVVDTGLSIDLSLSFLHLLVWKQSARDSLDNHVFGKQEVRVDRQCNQLIVRHVREPDGLEDLKFLLVRRRLDLASILDRQ